MSRHRIVRSMNYDDERYDDDEYDYGHSYEDRYCISPSTAAQFTFNREQGLDLSSFMHQEQIPEEEETMETDHDEGAVAAMSGALSDMDKARLQSCLEELHSILGETVPESVLTETVIRHNYNMETTLNEIFTLKEAPKPQRTERKKRDRTQEDDRNIDDLLSEIDSLDKQKKQLPFFSTGGRFRFREGFSPPGGGGRGGSSSPGEQGTAASISQNLEQDRAQVSQSDMMGWVSEDEGLFCLTSLSSQVKQNKSLSELVSETTTGEGPQTKSSGLTDVKGGSGLSLSQLVNIHGRQKTSLVQPESGTRPTAICQKEDSGVLSLTELVNLHSSRKSAAASMSASSQGTTSLTKDQEGRSLAQLISGHNPQSDVPSKSLSLADLIKGPALNEELPKKLSDILKADGVQQVKESQTGLSLADLVRTQSTSKATPSDFLSKGVSLAELAKKHAEQKPLAALTSSAGTKPATTNQNLAGVGSGLSLSDLVKQHHNSGSNAASAASPTDDNSHITVDHEMTKAVAGLEKSLKEIPSLRPDVHLVANDGDGDVPKSIDSATLQSSRERAIGEPELSLSSCLKKSLKLRPTAEIDSKASDSPESDSLSEFTRPLSETSADKGSSFVVEPVLFDHTLKRSPSVFARCICLHWNVQSNKRPCESKLKSSRKVQFLKFRYKFQTRKLQPSAIAFYHQIKPFDFSVPSPDDHVKMRQQVAFTRTGQTVVGKK